MRHVVTRAIGMRGRLDVEVREQRLLRGDLLLMCSDGLTDRLADAELCRQLTRDGKLEELCRSLVDSANEAGGDDNTTVTLRCESLAGSMRQFEATNSAGNVRRLRCQVGDLLECPTSCL
jgi:protein phosphatase